jgi:hypothetical protein
VQKSLVISIVGLAAASAFAVLGRQFQRYGEGKASYINKLERRYVLTAVIVMLLGAVGSALLTITRNGSASMFWWIFASFIVWEVLLFVFFYVRSRR